MTVISCIFFFFFFNDTATTEIYTLSLHDALPISSSRSSSGYKSRKQSERRILSSSASWRDRKSTRLNSSHLVISYAVFCLKKKKHTEFTHNTLILRLSSTITSIHQSLCRSLRMLP